MEITFENLPKAVTNLTNEVSEIKRLLLFSSKQNKPVQDLWFDLPELCNYLSDKPEKSAAYGWVSINSLHKRQKNDSQNTSQLQTIFQYLSAVRATASMVSDATGVPQKNLCRYKRNLEKAGRLWEVEKKLCKKTGFKAWYLTTNPANAPKNSATQLTLF